MTVRVVRLRPKTPLRVGDYDLDAFAIECDEGGGLDFRLELGAGLGIFWALPAGRNDRLRLAHVDGAAYYVDEPELIADPWAPDLPRLDWRGELGQLGEGRTLIEASFESSATPPRYRCELVERDSGGRRQRHEFAWGEAVRAP